MAPPLTQTQGAAFYGALLACVRQAESDGYAELPLQPADASDLGKAVAVLRGFAFRVRFAFRATPVAIATLQLRECCDGWPVELVQLDPPPASIVLVAQRRQGLIAAAATPKLQSARSAGTAF
ncbi:hypothetical protein [Roseiterribacter gracilis]|uniref:Uncharacterized protein n=1 Tax=Roseiterribacter gracilis TaxID=2812848 RepID=A0A8S8X5Y0_9PROT|nr:hypothetical protein TMPK1_00400 [Rhodospirillales bacterium TMPK1]